MNGRQSSTIPWDIKIVKLNDMLTSSTKFFFRILKTQSVRFVVCVPYEASYILLEKSVNLPTIEIRCPKCSFGIRLFSLLDMCVYCSNTVDETIFEMCLDDR